jgi:hypothetical protein
MQNLRVGEEFAQCEKFIITCRKLSYVSYHSQWEQFRVGSSLLIITKHMAIVKENKCDIIGRNSDLKN